MLPTTFALPRLPGGLGQSPNCPIPGKHRQPSRGRSAMGSWVTYGLGSENQDLPGSSFCPSYPPQGGAQIGGMATCPPIIMNAFTAQRSPILDLKPPKGITAEHQRENLNLLCCFNHDHLEEHPLQDDLQARIENYELAFRMQMQVPASLISTKRTKRPKSSMVLETMIPIHSAASCF